MSVVAGRRQSFIADLFERSEQNAASGRSITDPTLIRGSVSDTWIPVSFENCAHVPGPFYHGTRAALSPGDLFTTGHETHFEIGRVLKHLYFAALMEPAIWGAELSVALSGSSGHGHIYVVEPTGPFEDDPNLTNKRFAGNITRSYRSRDPLRIVGVVKNWQGHSAEVVQAMLDSIENIKRQGLYVIEE